MRARPRILIKGAGDLATGVALRLHRCGFQIAMTEIAEPTPVRRTVSFAEAVYTTRTVVQDVEASLVHRADDVEDCLAAGRVAVIVDPEARLREALVPDVLVDAIIAKKNLGTSISDAPLVIALGPGFAAGRDCHAVIETMRGHTLGQVIYDGPALPNTGIPGEIAGVGTERVLRAPADGVFQSSRRIGDLVSGGETVAYVGDTQVQANVGGVLRGLLRSGLTVTRGFKVGDIDPRAKVESCFSVSDKSLAIAGGVLEAIATLSGGLWLDGSPADAAVGRAGTRTRSILIGSPANRQGRSSPREPQRS